MSKFLCVKNDGSVYLLNGSIGCFYPKGSIINFVDQSSLIDFAMLLPDDVWTYNGDSFTSFVFTKNYFFDIERIENEQ